jgi:hypothetical protein
VNTSGRYNMFDLISTPYPNSRFQIRQFLEFTLLRQFIILANIYYIQWRHQIDEYEAYGNNIPEQIGNILEWLKERRYIYIFYDGSNDIRFIVDSNYIVKINVQNNSTN